MWHWRSKLPACPACILRHDEAVLWIRRRLIRFPFDSRTRFSRRRSGDVRCSWNIARNSIGIRITPSFASQAPPAQPQSPASKVSAPDRSPAIFVIVNTNPVLVLSSFKSLNLVHYNGIRTHFPLGGPDNTFTRSESVNRIAVMV